MEGLGPRYAWHDTISPAPCQANRLATQMLVLPWPHSNVSVPLFRVIPHDACALLSVDSIIYFSANFSNNRTSSRGNSQQSSRLVSRMSRKCHHPHTVLQRGIDPQVDDPDHCHVSSRSSVIGRIAKSVLESLRNT